jgi:hypothetical protein
VLRIRDFYPGSEFFHPGSRVAKIPDPEPYRIQKCKYQGSLETIFGVKILTFFEADPGSGIRDGKNSDPGWTKFGSGIRDKRIGNTVRNTLKVKKYI